MEASASDIREVRRKEAAKVLETNWREGFTIPCEGLYPFQWNWDSAFIALGWAHLDPRRARAEIRSLLRGQWKNGFLPHIVFHNPSDSYFPGPEVHQAELSPYARTPVPTSGITQPPVLGYILEKIWELLGDGFLDFVREVYPAVFKWHAYFYRYRDPLDEGLVYICHNWEAGTDNTPVWDAIWEGLDSPEYELQRRDTQHIDASNRPSNREYQHYIHLIEQFKSWKYRDADIAAKAPFLIQDPLFNALLIRSNESLIRLGRQLGETRRVRQLEAWQQKAKTRMQEKLWDPDQKAYVYYDLRGERKLPSVSSSSFVALLAGIPTPEVAEEMVQEHLDKGRFSGVSDTHYLCASFDPGDPAFEPQRYWRGPVWINLNWLIYQGLRRYGMGEVAGKLREDSLELLERHGFYEYFDPRKELPAGHSPAYGGANFSWSAALYLDFSHSEAL